MHRGAHQKGGLNCSRVPPRPVGVLVASVLTYRPGPALIPRLRSGFRQRAQTPAKRLNFG